MKKFFNCFKRGERSRQSKDLATTAQYSSSNESSMEQRYEASSEPSQSSLDQQPSDQSNRSCPICFESFNDYQCRKALTSCGHSFCEACLRRTLKIRPFCPICRQYQSENKHNEQLSGPTQLDPDIPWDLQTARAFLIDEGADEDGRQMRTVCLSNGERTNIHVDRRAKINVASNANVFINGKRIENPSDCNQQ